MKLSTHLLLPALLLLCTVPTLTQASSVTTGNKKAVSSTGRPVVNPPIFPICKSTKRVAIAANLFSTTVTSRQTYPEISGLIDAATTSGTLRYKISNDSTSSVKKTIASYTGGSPGYTLANNAYTILTNYSANTYPTITVGKDPAVKTITDGSINPGITNISGNIKFSDSLTFNDGNDTTQVFIIRVNGNLTIAPGTTFQMQNGITFSHVYFQVSGLVYIGSDAFAPAQFIALHNITLGANAFSGILYSAQAVFLGLGTHVNTMFDTDNDGVEDDADNYPNDATKANDNPLSSQTLAFEDLWPKTGDFDMNDMVVACDYNLITNGAGLITEITGNYHLIATGGVLHNGFGVEYPFAAGTIKICPAATPNAKIGVVEKGQTNAVIIYFTDMRQEMTDWNTLETVTHVSPQNLYTASFKLTTPVALSSITMDSFNPFIYRTTAGSRTEVHLPGKQPTSLADKALLGTSDDNSHAGTTYVTKTGLPFAIMIATDSVSFQYPVETKDISKAYPKFDTWARSGGASATDWYYNTTEADYRSNSFIYTDPTK